MPWKSREWSRVESQQPQAAGVLLSSHLHSKPPPAPPSIMRGFISCVCFSWGRMAGPLLASGVCSEQEEGEAEGQGRTRQASLLCLCGWPASGPLAAPGRASGGGKAVRWVSQLASVPHEFFCPRLFFQICSDEHRLYNVTMQSFNKIVFVILYSVSGQSGAG